MPRLHSPATASVRVLRRFAARLACMAVLALADHDPQGSTWHILAGLTLLTAMLCAVTAMMTQEPKFGSSLTHWDEAAAYVIIGLVARAASFS